PRPRSVSPPSPVRPPPPRLLRRLPRSLHPGQARSHWPAGLPAVRVASRRRRRGDRRKHGLALRCPPLSKRRRVDVPAIDLEHVGKDFVVRRAVGRLRRRTDVVHAVTDLSFSVEPGSLVGYIGPNGAGKSTTVKMLTGILVPSRGRISVAGLVPTRQRTKLAGRIGVMFGQRVQLWWDLPLIESFELLRHIYRIPSQIYERNLSAFRQLLDLDKFLRTPVRQLSLGQRIRGELTAAMLHDPEILFLDEPTIGLDVIARQRVRELLLSANRERGMTVLLTAHALTQDRGPAP